MKPATADEKEGQPTKRNRRGLLWFLLGVLLATAALLTVKVARPGLLEELLPEARIAGFDDPDGDRVSLVGLLWNTVRYRYGPPAPDPEVERTNRYPTDESTPSVEPAAGAKPPTESVNPTAPSAFDPLALLGSLFGKAGADANDPPPGPVVVPAARPDQAQDDADETRQDRPGASELFAWLKSPRDDGQKNPAASYGQPSGPNRPLPLTARGTEEKAVPATRDESPPVRTRKMAAPQLHIHVPPANSTRLASAAVNTRSKDYHLLQSPRAGDSTYYLLSDRPGPSGRKTLRVWRLDAHRKSPDAFEEFAAGNALKGLCPGNIIGFDLFHALGRYHLIYSLAGDLFEARSTDGLRFDRSSRLSVNTGFAERDPTVSPDGRWLAFTSNRSRSGLRSAGGRVYLARRASPDSAYQLPEAIPGSRNAFAENFPEFLESGNRRFLLFYGGHDRHELRSVEIAGGRPLVPVPVRLTGRGFRGKYPSHSWSRARGGTLFFSRNTGRGRIDFDLTQAYLRAIEEITLEVPEEAADD